jgi:hypothetical protein
LLLVIGDLSYTYLDFAEHYFMSFEEVRELIIPAIILILATSIGLA